MVENPLVSVCVANFNGDSVIEACLQSIEQQSFKGIVEVIVHDDASSDDSLAIIKAQFPSVRLIASQANVGFCVANNRMVAAAQGEFVLLLNNDAVLDAEAISCLLDYAVTHPNDVLTLPQFSVETGELLDRGMMIDLFANPVPNLAAGSAEVSTVMGSCLWINRARWSEVGGFPEWFGSIGEDLYLCLYMRLLGHRVFVLDQSCYLHHVGHSFGGGKVLENKLSTTYRRRALSELNKTRTMILIYPGASVALIVPHLLLLLIEGVALSIVKLSAEPLRQIYFPCLSKVLSEIVSLSRRRTRIQASRRISVRDFFSTVKWLPYKLEMLWRHGFPKLR